VATTRGDVLDSDGEAVADFTFSVLKTQVDGYEAVKNGVKEVLGDNSAPQVVDLVTSIVKLQVGEDEAHSPMLKSLVDDLGVDEDEVELAQDIILAGLDITALIAQAVNSGNPKAVLWQIMGQVSQIIPELEADIAAIKQG